MTDEQQSEQSERYFFRQAVNQGMKNAYRAASAVDRTNPEFNISLLFITEGYYDLTNMPVVTFIVRESDGSHVNECNVCLDRTEAFMERSIRKHLVHTVSEFT